MHPVLIQLGPATVMTHDAFTLLALAVGLAIYYRELRVRRWLDAPIVWISLAAVLGGAIGARVITSWEHLEVYGALTDRPFSEVIEHGVHGSIVEDPLDPVPIREALVYWSDAERRRAARPAILKRAGRFDIATNVERTLAVLNHVPAADEVSGKIRKT